MGSEFFRPRPRNQAPEDVSAGITNLANRTFDRVSDQLVGYAADEERMRDSGGVTLTADNEAILWDDGAYGTMRFHITDEEARQTVFKAFTSTYADEMSWPMTTHRRLIQNANEHPGPDRYKPVAAALLLHVLRDVYPEGDTEYREPLMRGHVVPPYSEEGWGERHKVGILLRAGYEDSLAPERPTQWDFGVSLQTRFDKPAPQLEIRSWLSGMVHTVDLDSDFKPDQKITKEAKIYDLIRMSELFGLAKPNMEPLVSPIEDFHRRQKAFEAMRQEYFGTNDSAQELASAAIQ